MQLRQSINFWQLSPSLMTSHVFCAVVMTMTMSTCFYRKSRSWCYAVSSQRGVGLLRHPGQWHHVLRLDDDNEHVLLSKVTQLVLCRIFTAWSFVTQVNGIMFYDLSVSGAGWEDSVYRAHVPYNPYNCNCLDVRCARGRPYTLGHLTAPVAELLSLLMRDVSVAAHA